MQQNNYYFLTICAWKHSYPVEEISAYTNFCRIDEMSTLAHILFQCALLNQNYPELKDSHNLHTVFTLQKPHYSTWGNTFTSRLGKQERNKNHSSSSCSNWLSEYLFPWDTQGKKKFGHQSWDEKDKQTLRKRRKQVKDEEQLNYQPEMRNSV